MKYKQIECKESKEVFGKYPCKKCCFALETKCDIPEHLECNEKHLYWSENNE